MSDSSRQFLFDLDQASIDQARTLVHLRGTDQAAAYYAGRYGPDSAQATNPWPAFGGHAQALLSDLLGIIDRDRAELAHTRDQVRQLADQLAAEKAARR